VIHSAFGQDYGATGEGVESLKRENLGHYGGDAIHRALFYLSSLPALSVPCFIRAKFDRAGRQCARQTMRDPEVDRPQVRSRDGFVLRRTGGYNIYEITFIRSNATTRPLTFFYIRRNRGGG
jgi:hypothetical protein